MIYNQVMNHDNVKEKLEGNIWKLHLYISLYSLIFFTPIIVLFFQENGLSFTQIMIIQALSSIIFIGLEVPSGYFADIYGRKTALAITGISAAMAMFAFASGTNFYHFLFASILWATAGVFISGADSALMYDTLKELKKEHDYKKIWGQNSFYYYTGGSIAYIIGGFLGKIDYRYSFYAIIPFMLCLIPVALSFTEPKRHRPVIETNHFYHLLKGIHLSVVKNKKLRWLLAYAAVIGAFIQIGYFFYQPYFQLSDLNVTYFGFVFAGFNIIVAISSKYSHLVEEKIGEKYSLILLFLLTAASFLLMSHFIYLLSFVFALLIQFVKGFSNVVISDYVHQLTTSDIRATVQSVKNLIEKTLFAVLSPFFGWMVDIYSLKQALSLSGILVFVLGIASLTMFWRSKTVSI
ncbi:MAG: MFS transporter [bacterium]|nr:MFS transporter [bacterium]